ncbi:MAG: FtsX-like permease family protein [Pseudomonadales bacterium]|nr:FtsX-like permease family protein [Pseudomonadales bacterium]MBO6596603.1 FtsX-like permease family protein [Pseudomonadales bacterium]MBO6823408.1 FtsX-like permease family protein [Pseudomonadales bacterium]
MLTDFISTIRYSKAGSSLLLFQVAFTFAVLVNVYSMVMDYRKQVVKDHGFKDEDSLIAVTLRPYKRDGLTEQDKASWRNQIERDLEILRGTLDVEMVSMAHEGVPLQNNLYVDQMREFIRLEGAEESEGIRHTRYSADTNTLELLGIEIVAGRAFTPEDVRWVDRVSAEGGPIILTQALADALFPDGNAVGQRVTTQDGLTTTVVGIASKMAGIWWAPYDEHSSFIAGRSKTNEAYLVRISRDGTGDFQDTKATVIQSLSEQLFEEPVERTILIETVDELRVSNLGRFIIINTIIGAVGVLLVIVTALGNYGQMSYTIFKRTKQIGIRRALGATKTDILRYFLTESALITLIGLVPGVLLMLGLNVVIINALEYGKFEVAYAIVCAAFMFALSWLSALVPIYQATQISPAVATRTV